MASKIQSYVSLEVYYMFSKVPTILWLLVNVQTYVHYLYLSGSTISLWEQLVRLLVLVGAFHEL